MIFDEFVAAFTGKPTDFDGIYPNQCMDLMHEYVYDVLNLTDKTILAAPQAKLVFENFDSISGKQYFTKIVNTPDNVPSKGDIIIWGQPAGSYKDANGVLQYAGHVAIFVSGDVNQFTSFDCNWPLGSLPHLEPHKYDGVLGWLSPLPQQPQVTTAQLQAQAQTEADIADQCQSQLKIANEQLTQTLTDKTTLQTTISDLQSKYESAEKEIVNLTTEIASFTTDRRDYAASAQQSKDAAAQLTEYLDTIAAHAGVEFRGQTDDKITSSVMLVLSQQDKKISDLTNQLKRYTDVKNAISQTVGGLPASPTKSFLQIITGIFWVQS